MKRVIAVVSILLALVLVLPGMLASAQPEPRPRRPAPPPRDLQPVDPLLTRMAQRPEPKTTQLSQEQIEQNLRTLQRDGWKPSRSDEPDPRVLRLDPAAFNQLKGPMLDQLRSAAFNPADLDRVAAFAKQVNDEQAKDEAVGVLVRSPDARAQALLIDVYPTLPNDTMRLEVIGALHPRDENDAAGKFLAAQLADTKTSPQVKELAARSLATTYLRQNRSAEQIPAGALRQLPAAERNRVTESLKTLRRGAALHDHELDKTRLQPRTPLTRTRLQPGTARTPDAPPTRTTVQLDPNIANIIKALKEKPNTPHYWAVKVNASGELVPAPAGDLGKPGTVRQILVMPTGYTVEDYQTFVADFSRMVRDMGNLPQEVFTSKFRDKIVYIAHWIPGGAMGSANANFDARLFEHPVRDGSGISMNNALVIQAVDNFKSQHLQTSDPIGVVTIFNVDEAVTANAVPPTMLRKPYGIARITRQNIYDSSSFAGRTWGEYVPMHEVGHGAINWLDEYIEAALDGWDINALDPFTFLVLPDGSWSGWVDSWESLIGNYTIRLSEILADNGSDNISTRRNTARVTTSGFPQVEYTRSGGMFFPVGTRHQNGNNVMNNSHRPDGTQKPNGDRFGWSHSPQQNKLLDFIFGVNNKAPRPNDRIRCAGPLHNWLPQWGSNVRLLIFDADKNHRWHPTTRYDVEIGWWEWDWGKRDWVWKSMSRTVTPSARNVDLSNALAAGGLSMLRDVLVALGVQDIPTGQGNFNLGALTVNQLLTTSLPSVTWPTPYQDVSVNLPIPMYQYYWRFRTYNGSHTSGWTGWSGFFKI